MDRGVADLSVLFRGLDGDPPGSARAPFRRAARPRIEPASMSRRTLVIGAVLCCLGLPAIAVLVAAAAHELAIPAKQTIVVSGEERYYLVYVPRSYDPSKPAPLVISMHGAKNWPASQMEISQWNRVADKHGFLVAYPAGGGG